MFKAFAAVAYDYGVNLMMTPNEQRERAGLPPLTIAKNNDVPKAVKCPICGGSITIQNANIVIHSYHGKMVIKCSYSSTKRRHLKRQRI